MLRWFRNLLQRAPAREATVDELAERTAASFGSVEGEPVMSAEDIKSVWKRHPDWAPGGKHFDSP